jgi:hypothetical protein
VLIQRDEFAFAARRNATQRNAWIAEESMHFSKRRSSPRRSWISPHAKERVNERCSLSTTAVRTMIDAGRCIWLGGTSANRGLNLIYSKADDCCFVVVQDTGNHAVVTVLPLWMWNNGTLLESSSQAEEARRLALEPQPPRRDGKRMRRQPQRPGGLFGRRR